VSFYIFAFILLFIRGLSSYIIASYIISTVCGAALFSKNMTLFREDIINVIATKTNVTTPLRQIIKTYFILPSWILTLYVRVVKSEM
jgi:hypothetical protein